MYGMFLSATSFNSIHKQLELAIVEDMTLLFFQASSFNKPDGAMGHFQGNQYFWHQFFMSTFDQPLNILDTSQVTNMRTYSMVLLYLISVWLIGMYRKLRICIECSLERRNSIKI